MTEIVSFVEPLPRRESTSTSLELLYHNNSESTPPGAAHRSTGVMKGQEEDRVLSVPLSDITIKPRQTASSTTTSSSASSSSADDACQSKQQQAVTAASCQESIPAVVRNRPCQQCKISKVSKSRFFSIVLPVHAWVLRGRCVSEIYLPHPM